MQRLRLAFEASRTTVAVCGSSQYAGWFGDQLGWIFGPTVEQEFNESRARLLWPDDVSTRYSVEQARWRAFYTDLLDRRPDAGERLLALVTRAREVLLAQYRMLSA